MCMHVDGHEPALVTDDADACPQQIDRNTQETQIELVVHGLLSMAKPTSSPASRSVTSSVNGRATARLDLVGATSARVLLHLIA